MSFHHLSPRDFFSYKQAHPLVLDLLLFREFQMEWLEWEPETLRQETARRYGDISDLSWAKMQAVKTLHVNPGACFAQWEVFLPVISALNNVVPSFDYLQAPTAPRLYAGVDMMRMADPEEKFSEEVRRFIAACLLHRGLYFAVDELAFVQPLLRRPFYVCEACGNKEFVMDDHDGICDACGKDWRSQATGRVKPNAPRVTQQHTYDETPVRVLFEKVRKDPESFVPHDDIPADVQVSKLLVALEYRDYRREQFRQQKEHLKL